MLSYLRARFLKPQMQAADNQFKEEVMGDQDFLEEQKEIELEIAN